MARRIVSMADLVQRTGRSIMRGATDTPIGGQNRKHGGVSMAESGKVNIHGKEYLTVSYRINQFRSEDAFGGYGIETDVVSAAELVTVKATITNPDGRVVATGYAEEQRGSTNINKTSALENAETSAVGRALAFLGFAGTEIASADEVQNAITQQGQKDAEEKAARCMQAVLENGGSVQAIKHHIELEELSLAAEAWFELDNDTKAALWLAESKGGPFTAQERKLMQSTEFKNAHYGERNE